MESDIKLKKELLNILSVIDSICDENSLTYFLVGGTLLGAKRHKGFIPWDDDLDIAMVRDDYNRFIEICNSADLGNYHFRYYGNDESYYLPFGKMCKRGSKYITSIDQDAKTMMEIFVDVFPLDYSNKEKSLVLNIQANLVRSIKSVLIRRAGIKTNDSLKSKLSQVLFGAFSNSTLQKWQEKIMIWGNNGTKKYIINLASNYNIKKQTMDYITYYPTQKIEFEEKIYNAPNNVEGYLSKIYGRNYMTLPPENERITHGIICLDVGD